MSEDATRPPLTPARRWLMIIGLAVAVIGVDQWSKAWALGSLGPESPGAVPRIIDVVGPLRFNLQFNTGMAFSKGADSGAIIGIIALVIVGVLLFIGSRLSSRWQVALVGIIVGGAIGNVIDRVTRVGEVNPYTLETAEGFMSGAVVDFIDVQFWPVWNVADMAVVVGGIALAVLSAFAPIPSETEPAPNPSAAGSDLDPAESGDPAGD